MHPSNTPLFDAVVLNENDDVATLLRDVERDENIQIGAHSVRINEPLPACHKIALRKILAGSPVRKYGEIIGEASKTIECGSHVHIHNLRSKRGK